MEPANVFTGEHFVVVDRRDHQAVLRAALELEREQELTPESRHVLRNTRQILVKRIVALEKEYAKFDTALEQLSGQFNELVGAMRNVLADRGLFQAKNAFYDRILDSGMPSGDGSLNRASGSAGT